MIEFVNNGFNKNQNIFIHVGFILGASLFLDKLEHSTKNFFIILVVHIDPGKKVDVWNISTEYLPQTLIL